MVHRFRGLDNRSDRSKCCVYCDIHSPHPPILQKWIIWLVAFACQIEPPMLGHIHAFRNSNLCPVISWLVVWQRIPFFVVWNISNSSLMARYSNSGPNNLDGPSVAIHSILPVNSLLVQDDFQGAKWFRLWKSSQPEGKPHCLWVYHLRLSLNHDDRVDPDDFCRKNPLLVYNLSRLLKFH